MASNKRWQEAILIVQHTESVTLLYTEIEVDEMMINKAYKFRIYPNEE
ncbi:helix-turn-helix domain-containing protein [Bacillus cereus]